MNHAAAARHAKGLCSAAFSLHATSQRLLADVPQGRSVDTDTLDAVVDLLGHTSAAVVLLSFSIEVIIKAIHGKTGADPARDHHLGRLFSALPPATQAAAEQRFIGAWRKMNGSDPSATFHATLDEGANAFEQWRYQFEQATPSLSAYIGGLQVAFEALQDQYIAP